MKYTSSGSFQAQATEGGGGLPVQGAVVRIYSSSEENGGVDFSLVTAKDGKTPIISLPSPNVSYSLTSQAPERAYATYNVEVALPGYYPKRIYDVAIFSDTLSVLPLNMVPDGGLVNFVNPPLSTDISVIIENEELE